MSGRPETDGASTRGQVSWALYDWANSPYTTLIVTFVFSAYFAKGVVGNEVEGQALWGYASAIAMACVATLSPIFGAIADVGGRRKPYLAAFTALCVVGSFLLWYAAPSRDWIVPAMIFFIIGNLGFEFGTVFYNAMLPDVAPKSRLGRLSGWAWGLGYMGGLAALVLALVVFVQAATPPFGLDKATLEHVRIVGPICGVWLALFSLPLFLWTPDRPATKLPVAVAIRKGLAHLVDTLKHIARYKNMLRFQIASMLYLDGLVTVFALGGIFAAGVHGMTLAEVIQFGIALNVTGGIGAFCFGWLDDKLGSKRAAQFAVFGLFVSAAIAVLAPDRTLFWVGGLLFGVFAGPTQAASRSMVARIAPPDLRTEFFGLYALTGKATAFSGPALVALVTDLSGSQRIGISVVAVYFIVGLALLALVQDPGRAKND
ncbi:MAG: MFS transporter [Alphaproteobacteria bacterium]|nr:MFS transporter [Alphaproteobacteria bacterium]